MRAAAPLWLALALAACARPADPPLQPVAAPFPAAEPAAAAPAAEPDITGRWRIVSLNGAPPQGGRGDRAPYLVFGPGSYGGNSGCNSFGGLGVIAGDRFYGGGAMQTAVGCGTLNAQESAILHILTSAPSINPGPDGSLRISKGGQFMEVRREPGEAPPPLRAEPPIVLAGTIWSIGGIDGVWLRGSGHSPREVRFEADHWFFSSPCGRRSGTWRQVGDRLEGGTHVVTAPTCPEEEAQVDSGIVAVLASRTRFATGPNGEILIGGSGHWLTGERPRTPLADEAALLAGSWRIVSLDGAPPVPGSAPSLAFGSGGYSAITGCNMIQGLFLAHQRRLHSRQLLRTEQACAAPLQRQESRIAALLGASPAIALAGEGELALVDAQGRLLLLREPGPVPGALPSTRIWNGEPLEAELASLNGQPLRTGPADPVLRLRLTAQRWDIYSGCGRLGGIWRRSGGDLEFLTDAEPPPEGACGGALVRHLATFQRLGNRPFRALIGRDGEVLIAGEEHRLAGRLAPPQARPR
jgi:heat shock protein HslJ